MSEIERRILPERGLANHIGGGYRPDATAWAVLAFKACRKDTDIIQQAQARLAAEQLDDGRVCISLKHPDAFWPTSLAILAWQGSTGHIDSQSRAVNFLLNTSGRHFERKPDSPAAHDTSIKGWPWIENTHSWVEPTALALIALRTSGYEKHPRAIEAINMLLDRQLPRRRLELRQHYSIRERTEFDAGTYGYSLAGPCCPGAQGTNRKKSYLS